MTGTISVLFLRTDTSATEQKVLDLLDLPTEEIWYTIPGEWYALSATLTDTLEPSVSRATLVAPDDTVVADESADPPVYSLTAEGDWQSPAQQDGYLMADSRLEPTFEFGVTFDSTGAPKPFVKLELRLVPVPAAEAGTVVIPVLDGDAAPVPLAEVRLYRVEGETQTLHGGWPTSILGKATFAGVPPGRYVVDVHKGEYCHVRTTVPFELSPKEAAEGTVTFLLPHRIKGEIRFIDGNKQPTTGSIGQVEVELLRGDDSIAEASESGPDAQGKYDYTFPCPPAPGSYTVRGTYEGGEEKTGQVTVNDDCSALWSRSTLAAMAPGAVGGAHSEVQGPVLVFTVQIE